MTGQNRDRIDWDLLNEPLLEKYSAPAPRYTSYPTAPEWTETFGPQDYLDALERASAEANEPLSLYVHLPYCKERCLYCGCAAFLPKSDADYDIYLDGLAREITAVVGRLNNRLTVSQLHWGGGTPTTLDIPRLNKLFKLITESFSLIDGAEVAIEANPIVTTEEQIESLAALGFNRLSLGVQDFTEEVQRAVGRVQSISQTERLIGVARETGFSSINIDLMYGLPKQRPETWIATLDRVISLNPDRLAVFGYAHVPWMRPHQKQLNESDLPDTKARFQLFRLAHDALIGAGYTYIGMDHYAKKDDELALALGKRRLWRNFQGYTVREAADLVGFGVTAISDVAGSFAQNLSAIDPYLKRAVSTGLATFRGMFTSPVDRLRRHIITQLMCNLHLDIPDVERRFGIDFKREFSLELREVQELEKDGLVTLDERQISVTNMGRIFVRHIGAVFDAYLREKKEGGPRFSKTL